MALPTSPINYIEALNYDSTWTGTIGESATVTYNFDYENWPLLEENIFRAQALNTDEEQVTRDIFTDISKVANLTFVETSNVNDTDIVIRKGFLGITTAGVTYPWVSFFSDETLIGADIVIDEFMDPPVPGNFTYTTYIHEIGHGLGLEHPHEGTATLPSSQDTTDLTLMSYNQSNINTLMDPATMMLYDVATLQYLYGANTTYNSGNTTITPEDFPTITGSSIGDLNQYNIGGYTFWDGGGNDTFDVSGVAVPVGSSFSIDIREGEDNYSNLADLQYIWMAFGANIENARGNDSTADLINGNDMNNVLEGLGQNDVIFGESGNDTLYGGEGNDWLNGNQGNDNVSGGLGNDTVVGGKDADIVNGNQGADSIKGNIGNDTLRGGKDNDTLLGAEDNDHLYGDLGNDFASGNTGNDVIYGGDGNDTLRGGQGNDTLRGGNGDDIIYGDLGNDLLVGDGGTDIFVITAGTGSDIITDLEGSGIAGGDLLQFGSDIFSSKAEVLASISYGSSAGVITLPDSSTVTIIFATDGRFITEDDILIS